MKYASQSLAQITTLTRMLPDFYYFKLVFVTRRQSDGALLNQQGAGLIDLQATTIFSFCSFIRLWGFKHNTTSYQLGSFVLMTKFITININIRRDIAERLKNKTCTISNACSLMCIHMLCWCKQKYWLQEVSCLSEAFEKQVLYPHVL